MKALVLAAGRGKRMEELSAETNKCLFKIHGLPLVEYSLNAAASIEAVEEIVVVVGYQAESIINSYGIAYKGKPVRYRIQYEQRGLVHAIESARPDLEGADFILFLGDEVVINGQYDRMVEMFYAQDIYVLCGIVRQEDPAQIRKTYAVIQSDQNQIFRLIEKPERPINNIMGTGNCFFRNAMFDYLPKVPIHHIRKEKELPDFIQCAVDDGRLVKSHFFCERYINVNTADELKAVEEHWPVINSED